MSGDFPPGRRAPEPDPGRGDAGTGGIGEAGDAARAAGSGQDGQDDHSGLPPFVSTWGGFYRLVLFTFLGLVLLFYAIQAAFR